MKEVELLLKLGTVFSGIGAIEQALKRLQIPYEIAFACDNGNVDLFEQKIEKKFTSIINEINYLIEYIQTKDISSFSDKNQLNIEEQIEVLLSDAKIMKEKQQLFYNNNKELISEIILVAQMGKDVLSKKNSCYLEQDIEHIDLNTLSEIVKDLKSDAELKEIITKQKKDPVNKEITSLYNSVISDINSIYERIKTQEVHNELSKLNSYRDKKEFVDGLYTEKGKKNFVQESYMANYEITNDKFHQNASFFDGSEFKDQIDLYVGGSPCQSFSMVGKRKGLEDTRGTLFYEYARILKESQPKVFIYENVKGLLSHDQGNTWTVMQQVFDDLNYDWHMQVLNSKDYGMPQHRERIFVVGFRKDLKLEKEFSFPIKMELKRKMQDFLVENVSGKYYLEKKGVDFVTSDKNLNKRYTQIDGEIQLCQKANQQFNWHGDFVFMEESKDREQIIDELDKYFLSQKVEKYVLSSGTKGFYSKPKIDLEVARPLLTTMHKMHRAGVDNYVTTEGRIRKLTPRECLRLMGFPDDFKIVVSDTQMYKQAGNSIVVNVLMNIVNSISESLHNFTVGGPYKK